MGNYGTAVDKKWQEKWEKEELYKFNPENLDKKLYTLEMFSYPSGSQLHAGHWFNYGPVDTWARLKRMQGYNVFQPMGFDAFGLPAENFAIKTGIHPQDSTYKNIKTMEEQLKAMGAMFNWESEVVTCDPEYYKWTQWLFLQLYKKGLAYRKNAPVNWCPSCNTVLANEQVVDGACERCNTEVTKKELTQWFLKITDYADELLDKLDDLDWPEKTVSMQKHWIGRSTGSQVNFKVKDSDLNFDVFTTRVDTLCGVSYVVLGHSERREYFNETDEALNKKVKVAFAHNLIPILCCGETLEQREGGVTNEVVGAQIKADLAGLDKELAEKVIIAYEPIWAIGTGKTATNEQANETIAAIRGIVAEMFGQEVADKVRIQYGGSVKPNTIKDQMAMSDIDGALVGGASLVATDFAQIVNY